MTTETVKCDHCAGTGMEPEVMGLDGVPIDPPMPCRSCLGQAHTERDVALEWIHPEPTDTEILDWMETHMFPASPDHPTLRAYVIAEMRRTK